MLPIASFAVNRKFIKDVVDAVDSKKKKTSPLISETLGGETENMAESNNDENDSLEGTKSWQDEMLKRLQNSAAPVPIKVACTVTPSKKPDYLGEEYHGSISREEEKKILEGKNGRYIVRDSFTSSRPHEYTLAFNFDESLQYIKLVYNPGTKEFRTDSNASMTGFKTVLDLITDVVNLYQKLKLKDSSSVPGISKSKATYNKTHKFKTHSYKHPKWCDVCGSFLWGFTNQGQKCEDCGINCHKTCCKRAPMPCAPITRNFKQHATQKENVENKSVKQTTTKPESNGDSNYLVISPRNPIFDLCEYFKQCSSFLSAFNIRDVYVDMLSNMTRCFCDSCISQTSGSDQSAIGIQQLRQWTRFQFEWQEDKLKRDLENWETVYFAINPKYVKDLVKGFFNPPDIDEADDIHVAPSLAYTTHDMLIENWSYQFTDTRTGGGLFAQTVLEAYLRPDSYEVIPGKCEDESLNTDDSNEHKIVPVHWKAKYKKDLYPKSILVKIFEKEY